MTNCIGTAIFTGIAIGRIQYYRKNEQRIRQYTVSSTHRELERYENAKTKAVQELEELYQQTRQTVGEKQAQVFANHKKLLENSSFSNAIESLIRTEKVNATYAVATTRDELAATFAKLDDDMVKSRVADIKELSERLINILRGIVQEDTKAAEPVIVMADQITPSALMEMNLGKIMALVTREGSPVSHTAILAKTMDIPTIIGIDVDSEWDGRLAVVDGYAGKLYLDPTEAVIEKYQKRQEADIQEKENLQKLKEEEDITQDGTRIRLYANIGNLEDLDLVHKSGACGIGMLRSEFQYLGRENYPREGELFRAYRKVAESMGDKPVIIRTLDIGADKKAEYMDLLSEDNPAMGNRGIRVCLERTRMFKAQLRAIYRASAYGNLGIMYPMITSTEEVREIEAIEAEVMEGLNKKNVPYKKITRGIMIETPAAVMIARDLAKMSDFLCIGTNDLTQYTLAMDRTNPALKKRYNDRHPAVMKMIEMTVKAGHKQGCWVGICGELAADKTLTRKFLKMGVDELSVVPANILPVRKEIRETKLPAKK